MTDATGETRTPEPPGDSGVRHVWTLELPFRRPLLNLNQVSGRHWSQMVRDKKAVQDAGYYLARHYGLPRPIPFVITAELIYWAGNDARRDADNMGLMLKALLDGVRRAGALVDDRARFVRTSMCTIIERSADPAGRRDARMALVLRQV